MVNNEFNEFINEQLKLNDNYIWLSAIIIHKKYREKYYFVCFEEDEWVNRYDTIMPRNQVIEELNNDIKNIRKLLYDYNKINDDKKLRIIINKLEYKPFIKSIMKELRELFYSANLQ